MATSASAEEALSYLKAKRPLGGWSVESKSGGMRLLRRRIPVTESFFLDIHHDPASSCVVGILSKPLIGKAQGQVLVDQDGKPTGNKTQIVSVSAYDPNKKSATATASVRSSTTTRSSATAGNNAAATDNTLSDEENKKLVLYGFYAVVGVILLRLVSQALNLLALLIVPVVYVYALQTCPPETTFDAKKELRRILRGHHLPENHPDKPKNFFDRTIARVSAAVTTELATGLGYEVTMTSIGNAAWFTKVRVPSSTMEFFWIGAFGQWMYVYGRNYDQ